MKFIFMILIGLNIFANEININFKNLKIMELIKITSKILDKNILNTYKIKGKVNFLSNKAINKENILDILLFTLESKGFTFEANNDIVRIIKINEKSTNIKTIKLQKYFAIDAKSELEKISKLAFNEQSKVSIVANTYDNSIVLIGNRKNIQYLSSHILKLDKLDTVLKTETRLIDLENTQAKDIKEIIENMLKQKVDNKGKYTTNITMDKQNNTILLFGQKNTLDDLSKLIKQLDKAKLQVYVKAKIIELNNDLLNEVGIKYGILGGRIHNGGLYSFSSSLNNGNASLLKSKNFNLQVPNLKSSLALGASLSLLNKTYALNILSQPSILCINNKESSIYVGDTVSIQTGTTITNGGNITNTYKRQDIGLLLKVKPQISRNNKVTLDIHVILEGIKNINANSTNPNTSKKEIITTAIVNNGESIILGGLLEQKNEKTIEKIPFLGDIPLLGELFTNKLHSRQNKNLVIIVTPYIIPKSKDLTYVRNELAKLQLMEDEYLEDIISNLLNKKNKKQTILNIEQKNKQMHEKRLKAIFNFK